MNSSPVIIAGMHRSGTSLLTSIVAASGVAVGQNLVPADRHNQRGYFEDVDFLSLNRRMLTESCDENDGGHPDWGWTESESLDSERFPSYRDEALRLIAEAAPQEGLWGFKDPRSTLLLDFWDDCLEDARFLLVYRLPWDVADSMQRLGADVFLRHPTYALRIWAYYNRHLLDFYRRHRDRALLVSTNALLSQPDEFGQLMQEKLGLEFDASTLESLYESTLLASSAPDDPLVGLLAATSPEVIERLVELDDIADLPATGHWHRPKELRAPTPSGPPKVAVVIPCRDHGQFLLEAIASVERSVDEDYELILVDDGSKEARTVEVLGVLEESGYQIVRLDGQGLSAARNRGFSEAQAEFVLPLDADNRLREGFISAALEVLENEPGIGAVYGEPWEFGLREGRRKVPPLDIDKLLEANYIDACSLLRKAMWWDVQGYDEQLPAWEDWDFWIRVATRGWLAHKLDMEAFDYRVRPNSLVTITEQEEVLESIVDRVTAKHRQLFHGHLTRRLGHVLAAWPRALERKRQLLAIEIQDLKGLEKSNVQLRLDLERAYVERLEAEKLAQRNAFHEEHRRLLQEQVDDKYRQIEDLQHRLQDQRLTLDEQHRLLADKDQLVAKLSHERDSWAAERDSWAAERDSWAAERDAWAAEREAWVVERDSWTVECSRWAAERDEQLRQTAIDSQAATVATSEVARLRGELEHARGQAAQSLEMLEEIHGSRSFRWLKRWWRLMASLRGTKRPSKASVAGGPPVEDGALGG